MDTEEKAKEHGWTPKEEFVEKGGDETNWVDAETWESRSKTQRLQADEIKNKDTANQQLLDVVERLEARLKTQEDGDQKKATDSHKTKAKEALAEGDETKLDEALDELSKPAEPYASPAEVAVQNAFYEEHPEYLRDDVDKSARAISNMVLKQNPGIGIKDLMDKTHEKVSSIYPEIFGNKERNKPSAVEGDGGRLAPKGDELSAEMKKEMEKYGDFQSKYGPYKGKSGKTGEEGILADKKLAMAGWKRSYDMENV